MSIGVYFFKFPNNFSMGGVSGLAVLLGRLVQHVSFLSPSFFNTVINLHFLILGFLLLDKGFGLRTVYCKPALLGSGADLLSGCSHGRAADRPADAGAVLRVLLPALGSAILFNLDASSGGTDIAAMILKKYTGPGCGPGPAAVRRAHRRLGPVRL